MTMTILMALVAALVVAVAVAIALYRQLSAERVEATRHEALAGHNRELARKWEGLAEYVSRDVEGLRAEVRRLTDVIIQMKQAGGVAPPWAGQQDEHWGSYVMNDEQEADEEERRAAQAAAEVDAEMRAALEDL